MSSSISILHLSDIHFKRDIEGKLPPYPGKVSQWMTEAISGHIKQSNDKLDVVVVTGDIAFSGKVNEYDHAKTFFKKLKSVLPIRIPFLVVPGNHDVDRDKVDDLIKLHSLVEKGEADIFLKDQRKINFLVQPKFESFYEFVKDINPLYESSNDYFWVKDFLEQEVSFLGLNSAWASEGNNENLKIALGCRQVTAAFEKAKAKNKIILLHHPLDNWLELGDIDECKKEIFKDCSLALHGHNHLDTALVNLDPDHSVICLGANASYTKEKNGKIGFQFIRVHFKGDMFDARVWPYILNERRNEFVPDFGRYKTQEGKEYFDISTSRLPSQGNVDLPISLKIPRKYTEWIQHFHSALSTDNLVQKGEVIKISLPELYIHIETKNPFFKPKKEDGEAISIHDLVDDDGGKPAKDEESSEQAAIDIETLLGRVNCVLLRGPAGMGKTTLVKHLAYTLSRGQGESLLRGYLPILIYLKDLWPIYENLLKNERNNIDFNSLLSIYFEKKACPLDLEVVNAFVKSNRALFLLDGIDEIPESLRPHLVEIIAQYQFAHKDNRFLITSRPHGIPGKAEQFFGDYLYDINPLDREKINRFVRTWFLSISGQTVGEGRETASSMISDMSGNNHIAKFIQNPLLLTAVCILYQDGKRLPEQRADLYNRIVDNLVYKRFHDPCDLERVGRVEEYLMNLAFHMQKSNLKSIEFFQSVDVASNVIPRKKHESQGQYKKQLSRFVSEIEPNCGLLNRLGTGEIEFFHLTFQEFLAARYINDKGLDYREYLDSGWWEETMLLYIGLVSLTRYKESNDFVKEILQKKTNSLEEKTHLHLLGTNALRDIPSFRRAPEVIKIAQRKLKSLLSSGISVKSRFSAGEILGVLGDPRLEEDIMVLIPEGKFIRGSESKKAQDREKPVREIYLDAYKISKYPVTNQEYRRFVGAGGYSKKEHWTDEGWAWKEEEKITEPGLWQDREWNCANFPVVGVSWYEASAYASWLSRVTGKKYRLPREAEWEKAARGIEGREYPWGNRFDKEKCNSVESGLMRTSPIGVFQSGQSPYQLFDMAGNVVEWCFDWFDEDYYKESPGKNPKGPDGGSYRVLRGGSWIYDSGLVRCACRFFFPPGFRSGGVGFRLSCAM